MNLYTVKFIDSNNELRTAKIVTDNRTKAKTKARIAFNVVEILEVQS